MFLAVLSLTPNSLAIWLAVLSVQPYVLSLRLRVELDTTTCMYHAAAPSWSSFLRLFVYMRSAVAAKLVCHDLSGRYWEGGVYILAVGKVG